MNYRQELHTELYYHIYNRTVGEVRPFTTDGEVANLLGRFKKLAVPYMDFLSYAIMANHYHLIVRTRPVDRARIAQETTQISKRYLAGELPYGHFLSDQIRRVQHGYAKRYNLKTQRIGALWEARFKRVNIAEIAHLIRKITYLHHNGIHHLGHTAYTDHPHTSYRAFLSDRPTLLDRSHVLDLFKQHDRRSGLDQFLEYHEAFRRDWRDDYDAMERLG